MSKDLFFDMRAEQMATLYDATFTKKEAVAQGVKLVNQILEEGLVDKLQFMSSLVRLKAVIDTAECEMRNHLPFEKTTVLGVQFTPVNGGESLNYKEDPIYLDIQKELKEREEILKLSYKSKKEIYDEAGIEVPKVSSSPRKSSTTIKF